MKIINVSKSEYFFVETDNNEWKYYRRNVKGNKDSWELLMGESWENISDQCELEDLFQVWISENLK